MSTARGPIGAFLFTAALLMASDQPAKITDLVHTKWSGGDIPFGAVYDLAQTKDGPLWLATDQGLFRFDGVRFTRFESLSGTRIRHLLAARDGSLWAVFRTGRVSRVSGGNVTTFPLEELTQTNAIAEDVDGSIVAATLHGGLARFQDRHWRDAGESLHHPTDSFLEVWFDRDGTLWVVTKGRLLKLTRGASDFSETGVRSLVALNRQHVFAQSPNGAIWFAENFSMRRISPGWAGIELKFRSNAVMVDRQGTIWVAGNDDGILRLGDAASIAGDRTAAFDPKPESFTMKEGLSGNRVFCLLEDREGNVWAGTDVGLDRFREGVSHRVAVLGTDRIAGLTPLRDGGMVVRTFGQPNLQRVGSDGKIKTFQLSKPPGLSCADTDGTIWVTTSAGVGYWTGERISYPHQMDTSPFLAMACGHGEVWVASSPRGMVRFSAGKAAIVSGLRMPAYKIFADGPGVVWAAYPNGHISVYDNGAIREYEPRDGLPGGAVQEIVKAPGGELWLAGEGGLARFRNGRFERADVADGLHLQEVALGDDGSLWLRGGGRLMKMDIREFDRAVTNPGYRPLLTYYGANEGITGVIRFISSTGKRIWVASSDGLWYLNLDTHPVSNPSPLPVQIETVRADAKTMAASQGMTLPRLTHNIQFDYTAFSLSNPEQIQFRYKLEGVDKDWQDAGKRRQAYYTDPSPGQHRFLVKASNNDGVWNENGAALDFFVVPAYYQTHWFQAAFTAVVLASLWGLYRMHLRKVQRQFNVRLEARVAERTRIARDFHDTTLQSFQGVLMKFHAITYMLGGHAEAREKLEGVIEEGRQAVTEGRNAVEGLRSSTVVANDLARAISTFGEGLAADQPGPDCPEFCVRVEGKSRDLPALVRDEVYRIASEALRNAFHHARAKRIEVEIRYDSRRFRLCVVDNGRGIDPAVLSAGGRAGHHGLRGLNERAELAGGKLSIWSRVDSGTEIELTVPAFIAYTKSPPARQPVSSKKRIG